MYPLSLIWEHQSRCASQNLRIQNNNGQQIQNQIIQPQENPYTFNS